MGGLSHAGLATSVVDTCYILGTMIGPSGGGFMFDLGGFILPFCVVGACAFCMVIVNFFYLDKALVEEDVQNFKVTSEQGEAAKPTNNEDAERNEANEKTDIKDKPYTWMDAVKVPEILISLLGLIVTSSAWDWYQPSLGPFISHKFGLGPTGCGLVLMTVSVSYVISSPGFGFLLDRFDVGIWAQVSGMLLIFLGYLFLGPIPQLKSIASVYVSVLGLALQGSGFAFSYLGLFNQAQENI